MFLVNLPICLVAVWFTMRGVSESRAPRGGRFDPPGTISFTVAAAGVTYGLIRAGDAGWTDGVSLAEVPRERSGMAGGTLNTFRQLGLAFGVAVFGTVFTDRIADGRGSPAGFADGLNATLLVAAGTALAAGILVLVLVRKPVAAPIAAQAQESVG